MLSLVSPTFSCKAARSGMMLADIFDYDVLEVKLRRLADGYRKRYGDLLKYDVEEELARFKVCPFYIFVSLDWNAN
jgi:adenylosuccinate synthase